MTKVTYKTSSLSERFKGVSDEKLLLLYLEGDERAFAALMERYRNMLHKRFLDHFHVTNDAKREELIQDVFARVARYAHVFNPALFFYPWFSRIAENVGSNWVRHIQSNRLRNGRRWFSWDEYEEKYKRAPKPSRIMGPLEECIANETADRINRVLMIIPEAQREAFILHEAQGMKYEEIALRTNTNVGTVKSRIHRAKKELQKIAVTNLEDA